MATFTDVHDSRDHTGIPGVGGGGGGAMALIETVTLGSDGTITFDAIPATYRDLVIVGRVRDDAASVFASSPEMQVGATTVDSGSNYDYGATEMRGTGPAVLVSQSASDTKWLYARSIMAETATAGMYTPVHIEIMDYASTTAFKTMLSSFATSHGTDARVGQAGGNWRNSGTAIDIVILKGVSGGSLKAGSSLTLYGRGS